MTTLQSGRATQLTPVSTPVVLIPVKNFGEDFSFGKVLKGDKHFARYKQILARATEEPFVLMVQAQA